MTINITPDLQIILDQFKQHPEYISVDVTEVSPFILGQIPATDVVSVDFKLHNVNGEDPVEGSFIIETKDLGALASMSPPFVNRALDEIVLCNCHVCVENLRGSHDDVLDNQGKPTFYIDMNASKATRVKAQVPPPVAMTPQLEKLIEMLKTIPDVERVWVETPLSKKVYANTTAENVVICFVDHAPRNHNKANPHHASDTFVLDEFIYNNEAEHANILASVTEAINHKLQKGVKQQRLDTVFDEKIFRAGCTRPELYDNPELNSVLDKIFALPEIQNRSHREIVGNGKSFAGDTGFDIVNLPEAKPIVDWITNQVGMVRKYIPESLHLENKGTEVVYQRSWSNRLYKGASALTHRHLHPEVDLVAVFYVKVPDNSGDIIFIRNGQDDVAHTTFSEDDKVYVTPEQGELILHTPETYHAVSENLSDDVRICFVFDIKLA